MEFLKNLFKKRYKVAIYLKSGETIHVDCTEFEIDRRNGNELSGYKVKGMKKPYVLYLRIEDVSAITHE